MWMLGVGDGMGGWNWIELQRTVLCCVGQVEGFFSADLEKRGNLEGPPVGRSIWTALHQARHQGSPTGEATRQGTRSLRSKARNRKVPGVATRSAPKQKYQVLGAAQGPPSIATDSLLAMLFSISCSTALSCGPISLTGLSWPQIAPQTSSCGLSQPTNNDSIHQSWSHPRPIMKLASSPRLARLVRFDVETH